MQVDAARRIRGTLSRPRLLAPEQKRLACRGRGETSWELFIGRGLLSMGHIMHARLHSVCEGNEGIQGNTIVNISACTHDNISHMYAAIHVSIPLRLIGKKWARASFRQVCAPPRG